jgi:hypothetical protein
MAGRFQATEGILPVEGWLYLKICTGMPGKARLPGHSEFILKAGPGNGNRDQS